MRPFSAFMRRDVSLRTRPKSAPDNFAATQVIALLRQHLPSLTERGDDMQRRTFLRLGAATVLGLPWPTFAGSRIVFDSLIDPGLVTSVARKASAKRKSRVIKVIGVGGAGGNAVDHMIREIHYGIEFICCNTDARALERSSAPVKLQLGSGLGAGGQPELAKALAEIERDEIARMLEGADIVFITAGLGGGTGTGASPIVARIAKQLGILSVAIVTTPFTYEGTRRKIADAGVKELNGQADAVFVIHNEKLEEVMGDHVTMLEEFRASDEIAKELVLAITNRL
jgi:hypothetical protein